jgi:MFS family permease|tara:strand:- start:114 stop:1334 length:1221 start_codon:yes stop_codon:yes gene_type:complete
MISFAALFLSIVLLQISNGGLGPLDALSGFALNFSSAEIGLLGSAHFLGFFIGCWYAPRVMGAVGHSRAFAAFAATGAIGLIAHMLIIDPYAWALMRIASGLCIAGCYTVLESWLQAKVTNETRGRTMGTYRVVDNLAFLIAQLLIGFLEPADYVSYNLLALICCASLLPLTLTKIKQPETPRALKLKPKLALFRSPLAVAGVLVAAVSAAAFRMVGPIYGAQVGLEVEQIAYFLSAYVFGGALAQYPIGWFADKYDRRWVLIWLSVAAIVSSMLSTSISYNNTLGIFLIAFGFGFTTFPIYSVAAAHAHDFASLDERVELSASLLFYYAIGAIAAPLFASFLMDSFGPNAMFVLIAFAHLLLVIFGVARMRVRPTVSERTPYVYMPRTSFLIGRLLKRLRDKEND